MFAHVCLSLSLSLSQDPNISRDFHANKLRDFVLQSDKVISVIKCQNQLRLLSLNIGQGSLVLLWVGDSTLAPSAESSCFYMDV